jgi:hypothetical protein
MVLTLLTSEEGCCRLVSALLFHAQGANMSSVEPKQDISRRRGRFVSALSSVPALAFVTSAVPPVTAARNKADITWKGCTPGGRTPELTMKTKSRHRRPAVTILAGLSSLALACGLAVSQTAPLSAVQPDTNALVVPTATTETIAPRAQHLIQSTGNLYWTYSTSEEFSTNWGTAYRMSKAGKPNTAREIYKLRDGFFLSLTYAKVGGVWYGYVSDQYLRGNVTTRIIRFPLDGSGTGKTILASKEFMTNLVADGTRLFWRDRLGIYSAPIGGGTVKTLVRQEGAGFVQLAGSRLFYAVGSQIRYMPKTGGASTLLATATSKVTALHARVTATGATRAYWGEDNGRVAGKSVGGSVSTYRPAKPGWHTISVSFDGSRVLWADRTSSSAASPCTVRARAGNTTTTIFSGKGYADSVQGDLTRTFWIHNGQLKRYTR